MAPSVESEVVRLRDVERQPFYAIAAKLNLGSKDSARRVYLRAKGQRHRSDLKGAPHGDGPPRSLTQFVRDKRREGCPVCALDAVVRRQLAEASSRKIPRAVQLEWLQREVGVKVTGEELSQHTNGRHDAEAA